jgi:glucoamylase
MKLNHFLLKIILESKLTFLNVIILSITILSLSVGAVDGGAENNAEFEIWVENQYQISIAKMLANFSRPDTVRGTIVAAPSYENPNYYYHWVRDASVAVGSVFYLLTVEKDPALKSKLKNHIIDFLEVSKIHQNQETLVGLGEVKFLPSGLPFLGPWGRPQTDGPAIRALVLTYFANYLLDNGETEFVRKHLYGGEWPASTVIKRDLEYISHEWQTPSFDIWEEVKGDHFFNRLVQAQTLNYGSLLAQRLNDQGAAHWYRLESLKIFDSLNKFWNPQKRQIDATLNYTNNRGKHSNLDSAVVLAVMAIGCGCSHTFGVSDERTIATVQKLIEAFKGFYPINKAYPDLAPGIGRYTEDEYDGYKSGSGSLGNPWFLSTAALASYSYRLAWTLKREGMLTVTELNQAFFQNIARNKRRLMAELVIGKSYNSDSWQFNELFSALFIEGDLYLKRMRLHMGADGSMSEQFHRDHGYMQGAPELTMNYTAFLRAIFSRRNLLPF